MASKVQAHIKSEVKYNNFGLVYETHARYWVDCITNLWYILGT